MENLTSKVVGQVTSLIKQLPPDYIVRQGKVYKRTVWTEFVAYAQLGMLADDSFCVNVVIGICAEVFKGLSLREKMTFSRKNLSVEHHSNNGAINYIYAQTVVFASSARSQKPFQRVRPLENLGLIEGGVSDNWKTQWAWPMINEAGNIVFESNPKDECRKSCRNILGERAVPKLIEKSIALAGTDKDLSEVVSFVKECKRSNEFLKAQREKVDMQEEYNAADPALYFSFARKPIITDHEAGPFVEKMFALLTNKCPNREVPIAELLLCIVRRLLGDQDAVYPLLYGPPGTAKTFILEQLCDAFNEAGIRTNYVLQPMTQSGGYSRQNNEVAMSLQGTSSKWGAGRSGLIYANTFREETELTLVALDEVDKCDLHDYLVTLLDPRQPLQDSYWRELLPSIDMRSKVMFFATCNDVEVIRKGGKSPLWSRLTPIEMDSYNHKESIDLVTNLVCQRAILGEQVIEDEISKIATKVVSKYHDRSLPSIRSLLDQVNRQLYVKRFPTLDKALSGQQDDYRSAPGIGFTV